MARFFNNVIQKAPKRPREVTATTPVSIAGALSAEETSTCHFIFAGSGLIRSILVAIQSPIEVDLPLLAVVRSGSFASSVTLTVPAGQTMATIDASFSVEAGDTFSVDFTWLGVDPISLLAGFQFVTKV